MRKRGKEVKGKGRKETPHAKIYIFCEGATEKIYLMHFRNRTNNIDIIPVDNNYTNALGIVKYAQKYLKENPLDLKLGDQGYCVFDADPDSNTNLNEVFNLLSSLESKGLKYIFSNPCFEVWFVMHFEKAPFGKNAHQMKRVLKELLDDPNYSETTDIYDILKPLQSTALDNAKTLHRAQMEVYDSVCSYDCNPYTNIFEFIEYIASLSSKVSK